MPGVLFCSGLLRVGLVAHGRDFITGVRVAQAGGAVGNRQLVVGVLGIYACAEDVVEQFDFGGHTGHEGRVLWVTWVRALVHGTPIIEGTEYGILYNLFSIITIYRFRESCYNKATRY